MFFCFFSAMLLMISCGERETTEKKTTETERTQEKETVTPSCTEGPDEIFVPFVFQEIRTDGYHEGIEYPTVTLIESVDALEEYHKRNKGLYDLAHREKYGSDFTMGFLDAAAGYDAEWFESHQLILVLLEEPSGSIRHRVESVVLPKNEILIDVLLPEVGTDDMAEWHILIEVEKVFDTSDSITVLLNRVAQ